jgi:SecD/SecF fusion protein
MNQRTFTGILVAIAVIAAILSIWRPWSDDPTGTLRLGLDLQGGLRVVLQAETPDPEIDDLLAARNIIENRVNEFGVAEPLVQTSGATASSSSCPA